MSDQEKDPVVHSSLSKPLFIWSALLVLSLGWGLYDEMYGIRPWKGYQARFEKLYSTYLDSAKPGEAEVERQIKASPEYRRLDQQMQAAEKAAMPEASAIDKQVNQELVPKILALNDPFQEVRSHIGALTYEIEVSHSESRKDSLRKQIEELKAEVHKVALPGESEKRSMKFDEMDQQLAGVEGPEGRAAAEARGGDEAGHRAARPARQVPVGPHRRRQHATRSWRSRIHSRSSTSASGRSTSRTSTWWTAASPATWARASRSS